VAFFVPKLCRIFRKLVKLSIDIEPIYHYNKYGYFYQKFNLEFQKDFREEKPK